MAPIRIASCRADHKHVIIAGGSGMAAIITVFRYAINISLSWYSSFSNRNWVEAAPKQWGAECSDAFLQASTAQCATAATVVKLNSTQCDSRIKIDVSATVQCALKMARREAPWGRRSQAQEGNRRVAMLVSGECDVCFEVPNPGGGFYCAPTSPALSTVEYRGGSCGC